MTGQRITIPRPHVPYGPEHCTADEADASYLREAARKLETHYRPFGSHLRATVVQLLTDAADAIERTGSPQPATTLTIRQTANGDEVFADDPAAPDHMRNCPIGRLIAGGFQPAPFAAFGFRPDTLAALADLIRQFYAGQE